MEVDLQWSDKGEGRGGSAEQRVDSTDNAQLISTAHSSGDNDFVTSLAISDCQANGRQ